MKNQLKKGTLAMSFGFFTTAGSAFATSEAVYRTGNMGNYLNHAGVRKAGVGVNEIKFYGYTVDLMFGEEQILGLVLAPQHISTFQSRRIWVSSRI